jgi:hypothetical protein
LTGSWTLGPGRISSRVVSDSPLAERDVLVQRRVLVAGRGLHRGDDLAGDAELGEVAKARLTVGPVVADRLVEAEQALLDQVVRLAPEEEVRRGLQADETAIPLDDRVVGVGPAVLGEGDKVVIVKLSLRVSSRCHRVSTARHGWPKFLLRRHKCHRSFSLLKGRGAAYLPRGALLFTGLLLRLKLRFTLY